MIVREQKRHYGAIEAKQMTKSFAILLGYLLGETRHTDEYDSMAPQVRRALDVVLSYCDDIAEELEAAHGVEE